MPVSGIYSGPRSAYLGMQVEVMVKDVEVDPGSTS
jgi:hypothetical protein